MMKEIELQTDVDFCMNLSRIILVIVLDTYLHIQQIAIPKDTLRFVIYTYREF